VISSRARTVADWVIGLSLIALGVVGGFVPVLQGWVFIVAGLAVLSSHSRVARGVLDRLKRIERDLRDRLRRWRDRRRR
jgi:uncharacterized membrane protein YbaN (DUF454 family)